MKRIITVISVSYLLLFLAGCSAVGPDYIRPETLTQPEWYTSVNTTAVKEVKDPSLLKEWWLLFNDETLNELIAKAAANSTDLQTARYALSAARAQAGATKASTMPSLSASGAATATHYGDSSLPDQNVSTYNAGSDASWELDFFGGKKREVEAATADMQAQQESMRDILVSLLAETATNYINIRKYQHEIINAQENIRLKSELYSLASDKRRAGLTDESDMRQTEYQLEYAKSSLYSLRIQLKAAFNRISALTGDMPGEAEKVIPAAASIPDIPAEIATGIPADLIRRRPDIRMAERQLAAQTARVGTAKADMYPSFTLAGSIGYESDSTGSLFKNSSSAMSIGPSFRWAVFDFGAVRKNIAVQTETQKEYLSKYETAVLGAFEEADNAMSSFDHEYHRNLQLKKAVQAAEVSYDLEMKKYKAGLTDISDVITAQSTLISYRDELTVSLADTDIYLISLYKALGGGWEAYEGKNEKK